MLSMFHSMCLYYIFVLIAICGIVVAIDPYNMGDVGIVEDVMELRRRYPDKLILFTDMRYDGAGAEVLPMVLTAAYARKRNWIYGGAIRGPPEGNVNGDDTHGQDVAKIANFMFGRRIAYARDQGAALIASNFSVATLKYRSMSSATPCLEQECRIVTTLNEINFPWMMDVLWMRETNLHETAAYKLPKIMANPMHMRTPDGSITKVERHFFSLDYIVPPSFLKEAREVVYKQLRDDQVVFKKDGKVPSVAFHVRRGKDVDQNVEYSFNGKALDRFTKDEYYYELAEKIRSVFPNADIHVFSSLEGIYTVNDFKGYADLGMTLHFEEVPIIDTWANMMMADILVMAKSSFSFLPGMLSDHCVVFDEFSFEKRIMNFWKPSHKVTANYIEHCYKKSEAE